MTIKTHDVPAQSSRSNWVKELLDAQRISNEAAARCFQNFANSLVEHLRLASEAGIICAVSPLHTITLSRSLEFSIRERLCSIRLLDNRIVVTEASKEVGQYDLVAGAGGTVQILIPRGGPVALSEMRFLVPSGPKVLAREIHVLPPEPEKMDADNASRKIFERLLLPEGPRSFVATAG
jgi:hypothetical protein